MSKTERFKSFVKRNAGLVMVSIAAAVAVNAAKDKIYGAKDET